MTLQEFKNNQDRKNRFDRYFNYLKTIIAIVGGFFFLYGIEFTNWYEIKALRADVAPIFIVRIFYICLIGIGFYGFWRIPQLYKLSQVEYDSTIEDKLELIKKVQVKLNLISLKASDNSFEFKYHGLLYTPFLVQILVDAEGFFLNVQQVDLDGGFIDFGNSKRVTNKIIKIIIENKNVES